MRNLLAAIGAVLALSSGTASAQLPGLGPEGTASIGGAVTETVSGATDAAVRARLDSTLRQTSRWPGVRTDVVNGVAMLSGTVASEAERAEAAELARQVEGVIRVRNDITVRGGARAAVRASAAADSGSLASAVRANLEASGTAWGRAIEVETVAGQVVRLRGEVETEAEKVMAARIAADTPAVARVQNDLVVRSGPR